MFLRSITDNSVVKKTSHYRSETEGLCTAFSCWPQVRSFSYLHIRIWAQIIWQTWVGKCLNSTVSG